MEQNIEIKSNGNIDLEFKLSILLWITFISIIISTWKYILYG